MGCFAKGCCPGFSVLAWAPIPVWQVLEKLPRPPAVPFSAYKRNSLITRLGSALPLKGAPGVFGELIECLFLECHHHCAAFLAVRSITLSAVSLWPFLEDCRDEIGAEE